MPKDEIDAITLRALQEAEQNGVTGKKVTPFLLARIKTLTEGRSLKTNIALVKNNARVGAALARELQEHPWSIDLKQLKYFLAVAEEKSFSRAAERLHISQPPLSQQIMKLEAELGVKLFARTTRTFELTVAGKALMQEASDLLAKMRMTIDTVRQIDRGEVGRLRVGIVGSAMWGPIPSMLEEFQSKYPRVTWTIHESGPTVQYDALRAKQIGRRLLARAEAGTTMKLRRDNLKQELCFRENVCVAVNEHHPLAKMDAIELADIADDPMLTLALDKSAFPRYLIQCCVNAGFHPEIFQEAHEPQTLLAMVGAGLGVTLMPETTARIGWPGVVFLPIRTQSAVGEPVHHLHHAGRRARRARLPQHTAPAQHLMRGTGGQRRVAVNRQRRTDRDAQSFLHLLQRHAGRTRMARRLLR